MPRLKFRGREVGGGGGGFCLGWGSGEGVSGDVK